ncbi:response regulator [uncultured Vibrio sp.]|uniref:response regulator n=1 Tax=uncultured Vibrio sp. TaxID=114054 RepID=UPI0026188448|nr:response regulator [uncultured Vibrio sp.]
MYKTHSQTVMTSAQEIIDQKCVMLVDDDPIFRHITSKYLHKVGYKVVEVENGLEALQKLRGAAPDLIVCDLSMPILDGIELVEELSLEYPSMPMIVVSATDDMSDVARALKFGIKDFLMKPVDHRHLGSAIANTLVDSFDNVSDQRDFSSQWFCVDGGGEIPEDQELHWHLNYLQDNPSAAKDLLHALLPEKDTQQGSWRCSYRLLQSTEMMPLVFDYAWMMNGQFAFYLVDSASPNNGGSATTLLVRALFHDYLRNRKDLNADLKDIAEIVEKGMRCSKCVTPVNALFGVANLVEGTVSILPAGLDGRWSNGQINQQIAAGVRLGEGCKKNFITRDLPIEKGCKLSLSLLGTASFSLDICQGVID